MRTLEVDEIAVVSGGFGAPEEDGGGGAEPRMLTGSVAFQAYGVVRFSQNALLNDGPMEGQASSECDLSVEDRGEITVIAQRNHHPADIQTALWLLNQRDQNLVNANLNVFDWFNNDPRSKAIQAAIATLAAGAALWGPGNSGDRDNDDAKDGSHPFDPTNARDLGPLPDGGRWFLERSEGANKIYVSLNPDGTPYARYAVVPSPSGGFVIFQDRGFDNNYEVTKIIPRG